jgi:hypothetical protein
MKKLTVFLLTLIVIAVFVQTSCISPWDMLDAYEEEREEQETDLVYRLLHYLTLHQIFEEGEEIPDYEKETAETDSHTSLTDEQVNKLEEKSDDNPETEAVSDMFNMFVTGLGSAGDTTGYNNIADLRIDEDETPQDTDTTGQESSGTGTQENLSTYQDELDEGCVLTVNVDNSTNQVNGSIDYDSYIGEEHRTLSLEFDSTLVSDNSFEAIASGMVYSDGEPVGVSDSIEVKGKISDDGKSISGTIYDTILKNTLEFLARKIYSTKEDTDYASESDQLQGEMLYRGVIGDDLPPVEIEFTIYFSTGILTGVVTYEKYWEDGTFYTFNSPIGGTVDLNTREISASGEGGTANFEDWKETMGRFDLTGKLIKLDTRAEGYLYSDDGEYITWYADQVLK